MSEQKHERFGRYLILDHLIDGGMAKICRARFLSEQVDRIVIIKVIKSQFSQDENFKTMFMNEIKTTFGLVHPNIIQIYDYGFHNSQLYVAMEYCDGRNLKEYLEILQEKRFVFPVEVSTYIVAQACQGLHYAHNFIDKLSGKKANIVHRDISPHNIMMSYDGSVKVIDFGIAKAESNSEATQAGTIKGKLSYLAPEYLEGLPLDCRYDEFAIGITLWEMLCNRRLFKSENDLGVLKQIQECKIPLPSSVNPKVPKELDEIVMKALSKDRNNRYENLDALNRVLMRFLNTGYPNFNPSDLTYFAKELFREDIKKDREKLFQHGKLDIATYMKELEEEDQNKKGGGNQNQGDKTEVALTNTEQVFDFGFKDKNKGKKKREVKKKVFSSKDLNDAFGVVKKKDSSNIRERYVRKKANEGTTITSLTKEDGGGGGLFKYVSVTCLIVGIYFLLFNKDKNAGDNPTDRQANEVSKEARDTASSGEIVLANLEKSSQNVFVNGKKIRPSMFNAIKVPLKKKFTLRVQSSGRKHYVKEMIVNSNEGKKEITIPETELAMYGFLIASRPCNSGKISFEIFGEKQSSFLFDNRKEHRESSLASGIAFPIEVGSSGDPITTEHQVYFKELDGELEKRFVFNLSNEGDIVELCDLIANS